MKQYSPGEFIAGEWLVKACFGGTGKSGMGVVYLVEERTHRAPFVLKTYQSERSADTTIKRFKREAETWVRLGIHANIVECYWVRVLDDTLFIAAEYIAQDEEGRNTLTHHIHSSGVPLAMQIKWFAEACYGLRHAYRRGLVAHRDIKPDNLMIDSNGRLKVTDFGLVKTATIEDVTAGKTKSSAPEGLTIEGSVLGTLPFMPLEQFCDAAKVDHRSDIYSLGVVLFMMISKGQFPIVPERQPVDRVDALRLWEKAHRNSRIMHVESPLMPIVAKCLAKLPDDRYQAIDNALDDLTQVCKKLGLRTPLEEEESDVEFRSQYALAQSLVALGKDEEAIRCLQEIITRWPNASEAYTELGRTWMGFNQNGKALAALKKSVTIYPDSSAAWNNIGAIHGRNGDIKEAKFAYQRAVEIDPENTGAMIGLAQAFLFEDDHNEADAICRKAYSLRPEKPNVLKIASQCAIKIGDIDRAIELLTSLTERLPQDAVSWFNLSLCYHTKGLTKRQIDALQKVIALDSQDGRAHDFLADALVREQEFDEAILILAKMTKIPNWDIRAICKWAEVLAHTGKGLQGYALLTKWLQKYELSADLWYTMAWILKPFTNYRSNALTAANNALACLNEDPKQLRPEDHQFLRNMIQELR